MTEIKKILFPVDFSDSSNQVADYVLYLIEKFEASLYVVHVLECLAPVSGFFVPHTSIETLEVDLERQALKKMDDFVHEQLKNSEGTVRRVIKGIPNVEIIKMARENSIDLIVMGTHGWTGLPHVLFGSVAEKVVRNAPCPVMTVRMQANAEEAEHHSPSL